jgi:hypothetical protein
LVFGQEIGFVGIGQASHSWFLPAGEIRGP